MNLKNILETSRPDRMEYTVITAGNKVWDFKVGGHDNILLIDTVFDFNNDEEEYVTVGELRKYVVACEIPFDVVTFRVEQTGDTLDTFAWNDEKKTLTLDAKD
jgi:hypothetical protein